MSVNLTDVLYSTELDQAKQAALSGLRDIGARDEVVRELSRWFEDQRRSLREQTEKIGLDDTAVAWMVALRFIELRAQWQCLNTLFQAECMTGRSPDPMPQYMACLVSALAGALERVVDMDAIQQVSAVIPNVIFDRPTRMS